MDRTVIQGCRRRCRVPVLLTFQLARANFPCMVIVGWMLAGLLLLSMVCHAMTTEAGEVMLDPQRQDILRAHPEWPPEVRAAVLAGMIYPGMSRDMVQAAWGPPTRTYRKVGAAQHETWHYEGRPRAMEQLGGQGMHQAGAREWTVSFIDGRVVGWTD
jgi:hypothetical protein